MATPRRTARWIAATAGVTLTMSALASGAATAAPAPDPLGPRMHLACARVPNLLQRTNNLITRLEGDATTIGSLAWLQTQIDRAQNAGRDQLVTVLQNRLTVRTAKLELLKDRRGALDDIASICAAHGA